MIINLREYLDANVPSEFLKDLIRFTYKAYKDAKTEIKDHEYSTGPAKNLYPYVRWCKLDDYCLALRKYAGFETSSEENTIKNSYYTLVKSNAIKLTVSAVKSRKDVPRQSLFRNDHASCQSHFSINNNGQFEIVDISAKKDEPVYAFVVHGPINQTEPHTPGFIGIGFPDAECKKYLDYVDLCAKYPDVVEEILRQDVENIPDTATPKIHTITDAQSRLI